VFSCVIDLLYMKDPHDCQVGGKLLSEESRVPFLSIYGPLLYWS